MTTPATPDESGIARQVEFTEAAAYADLLRAAPAGWRCIAERTSAGWFLMAPTLDVLLFNRVLGGGLDSPAERTELVALVDRYRAAGLRNFGVAQSPAARPTELATWLREAGLEVRDRWTKVHRATGPQMAVATDLRVELAGPRDAGAFARITCAAHGLPAALEPWIAATVGRPGWRHYLAWGGREAVAAAALYMQEGTGWLGMAGTLPVARRRGAQGALMVRRLFDGAAEGCRWFVTETGEDLPERPNPSFRNMMRMGFEVAYQRPNLMPARR